VTIIIWLNAMDNSRRVIFLSVGSQLSVAGRVVMRKFEGDASMAKISTAQQCMAAAEDEDVLTLLEDIITTWCKKIEIVCSPLLSI